MKNLKFKKKNLKVKKTQKNLIIKNGIKVKNNQTNGIKVKNSQINGIKMKNNQIN